MSKDQTFKRTVYLLFLRFLRVNASHSAYFSGLPGFSQVVLNTNSNHDLNQPLEKNVLFLAFDEYFNFSFRNIIRDNITTKCEPVLHDTWKTSNFTGLLNFWISAYILLKISISLWLCRSIKSSHWETFSKPSGCIKVLKGVQEDFHMLQKKLIADLWKNEFELTVRFELTVSSFLLIQLWSSMYQKPWKISLTSKAQLLLFNLLHGLEKRKIPELNSFTLEAEKLDFSW